MTDNESNYVTIKEFESSKHNEEHFLLRVVYNQSAKEIECKISKAMQVNCCMESIIGFDKNNLIFTYGAYKTKKSKKIILIGKDNVGNRLNLLRNRFNDLNSQLT